MTLDTASLLRLMSWLSPAFPTGAFAWSAGLEQAVADGDVPDDGALLTWIATQISIGSAWQDAVIAGQALNIATDDAALGELSALAMALAIAAQRRMEISAQGQAFADAGSTWSGLENLPANLAFPVALGAACGRSAIGTAPMAAAFLHAFAVNQCQAAIRLSVTGQTGTARCMAALEPLIARTAAKVENAGADALGTSAFLADIAAMNHEALQPRLFRS